MADKKLLELRKKIKSKKPVFVKQDAHKQKKLSSSWRRPRGIQSKMRLHKRGYRTVVSTGYGSPAAVKGLHKSGLKIVLVSNLKDIESLNPKTDGILISSKTGMRKRIEIMKSAKEKGISVLNKKDSESWLKESQEKIEKRKEDKKKKLETKSQKKKELEKKSAEKKEEKLSDKLSEEEKKAKEKQEKDKVLIQK